MPIGWALAYDASWIDASTSSGTLAPGGGGATVTLSLNSQANNLPLGSYSANVRFTNLNDGSVQNRLFTLAVISAPVAVSGLVDQSLPEGGTATFTIVVTPSSLPARYQWSRDGIFLIDDGHISGAASSTQTISNVSAADVGTYHVFVANTVGVLSSMAPMLTVASPPVIVAQAADQIVLPGATAEFAVKAAGTPPLFYQWQNNGTNLLSGRDANVLTVPNVDPADAGTYSVVVSNALGMATNAASLLSVIPVTVPGVTLSTLYSFAGANDGANPNGLIQATDGNFYGTANSGGASNAGTAFRITTEGTLTTLHAFTGGNDGGAPKASLIQATDGNFYGTTLSGGANFGGTAFRMSVNGALTTLHAFGSGTDGSRSFARLLQATDGNFYGAAYNGGVGGSGMVFKITSTGQFTTLHSFNGAGDGQWPQAALVEGRGRKRGSCVNNHAFALNTKE